MLDKNLSVVEQRWPDIAQLIAEAELPGSAKFISNTPEPVLSVEGIHLSSAYNQHREAEIQAGLVPHDSEEAWVYGIGVGELPRVLLARPSIRRLTVVLFNSSVVRATFSYFDHCDWLSDPRVNLVTAQGLDIAAPMAASPACLLLADDLSAQLRDKVFLELSTPFLNKRHAADLDEVKSRILENEQFVKIDHDVAELFSSQSVMPFMVAGAGPSLTENMERLSERRDQFKLVAVNSALKPLLAAGLIPDIVVTVDPDLKIIACFEGYDLTKLSNVPMVYFPRVPTAVLKIWPGPRFAAYSSSSSYRDINAKYPRGKLYTSGSALHTAVDMAVQMGGNKIVLVGADLAFPGGVRYASGAGWEEVTSTAGHHWVLDGHGKRIETTAAFRGYLRDLEDYIRNHPQIKFCNSSLEGAHIEGTTLWED